MPTFRGEDIELEGVLSAARLMAVSARTAPKGRGRDTIKTLILTGEEKDRIADEMERIAREKNSHVFERDAGNLRKSQVVLLIGVDGKTPKGLNCGACGFSCAEMERTEKRMEHFYSGPNCIMYVLDLGIAIGSAVKTASLLNVDNRVMFTIGAAAKRLNLLDSDIIIGIPLAAMGKSPYFDRK